MKLLKLCFSKSPFSTWGENINKHKTERKSLSKYKKQNIKQKKFKKIYNKLKGNLQSVKILRIN